nr:hypothetical protein [Tanacetum cinerariifolium]
IIWNPTIRKSVNIVVPLPKALYRQFYNPVFGFGVCPRTLDHMLVRISTESGFLIKYLKNTTWAVEVFRLSSRVWKSLCVDLPTWSIVVQHNQVVIDKFIYWCAINRMNFCHLIMSFDMISEKFMEIRLTGSLLADTHKELCICKLKESLVVLQYECHTDLPNIAVWMMDNVATGCVRKFTKELDGIFKVEDVPCSRKVIPIAVSSLVCSFTQCFRYFIWSLPFRSRLTRKASLFLITSTFLVLVVGMPISTGITASVPYVNENGVSPLFDLIMDSFCKIFMNMSCPCVPFFFHHCPYTLTIVVVLVVPKTKDSPAVPEHTTVETLLIISLENKAHYQSKKESIHLILTGIGDEICSTIDACKTSQEMWEAIERLQHGESLNIQDVKTNLYWEFGKFTSHDEETMESYYTRYMNDNQSGQFRSQRTVNVTGARENVGSPVVQQSGIQCFNCKEFGHFAKEYIKPKRVKDLAYHKEKMLLCKQSKKGVPLQVEQSDWLADTDEEIDEQELEAHYSYMVKIQEVPTADSELILSH